MVERPTSHEKGARNARALIHGAFFPWTNGMLLSSPTCSPAGTAKQRAAEQTNKRAHFVSASAGVRGIVAGDIFRRVVVRTMVQQLTRAVEASTARFKTRCKREWPMRCKVISELCTIGTDEVWRMVPVMSLRAHYHWEVWTAKRSSHQPAGFLGKLGRLLLDQTAPGGC